MTTYFKITAAPAPLTNRKRRRRWQDLFLSMKSGDWFYVPEEDHGRVAGSANNYVKGKYTMYKVDEGYCFKLLEEV